MTPERWGPRKFLKSCTAVDAVTGKRCTLLEHVGEHSASGRPFTAVLQQGFQPLRPVDSYARMQRESAIDMAPTQAAVRRGVLLRAQQRQRRLKGSTDNLLANARRYAEKRKAQAVSP